MDTDVASKVIKVLALSLDLDSNLVSLDSRFRQDLGIDSLNRVEAIVALEAEFGTDLPDSKIQTAKTVRDVVQLVEELVGAESPVAN